MDTQTTEIIGTHVLVAALLRDGIEVAMPQRDHGIDLLAYLDLEESAGRFFARPIQIKAATHESFGVWKKYEKFPDLLLAHVWNLGDPLDAAIHCLSYREALSIAKVMGWTKTNSWVKKSAYSTTAPSKKLKRLLTRHRMEPGQWRQRILASPTSTLLPLPGEHNPARFTGDPRVTPAPEG